jgi:hypothetical protein
MRDRKRDRRDEEGKFFFGNDGPALAGPELVVEFRTFIIQRWAHLLIV